MFAIEGVLDHYGVEYDPDKLGNQMVLCPFHDDSIPSASVNLDLGLFNCYGCDMSGDGIALIQRDKGLEFLEAKRLAEEMAGGTRRQVSREPDRGSGLLPRKAGTNRGNRKWSTPWGRR